MHVNEAEWLVSYRKFLDRRKTRWLRRLAEFDTARGWEADGQQSCVEWLVHFARMDRSTALEAVRAAHAVHGRSAPGDQVPPSRPPSRSR